MLKLWGIAAFVVTAIAVAANPVAAAAFTDPRGDATDRPGTWTRGLYGPFTVPAASGCTLGSTNCVPGQIEDFPALITPPCTNCGITDIVPDLMYGDGTDANHQQKVMLHHLILFNPANPDSTCPTGGLFSSFGDRFFASGNERTHIHLPGTFGYPNTSANWRFLKHLVNFNSTAQTLYVEIWYRWRPLSETTAAKPVWLDVANCGTSEYTAPPGFSDVHVDWTSNVDGSIVAMGGHVHDIEYDDTANCPNWPFHCDEGGGIAVSLELLGGPLTDYFGPLPKPTHSGLNGATACRSKAYYGTSYGNANGFAGHLDTMSTCGIFSELPSGAQAEAYPRPGGGYSKVGFPIRKGQVLRLHSEYQNNTGADRTDVMGILTPWIGQFSYPRPVGASPIRIPLIPAFEACSSANSTHGAPLNFPSCNPPAPASGTVKVGNGAIGYGQILVCGVGAASAACKESAPGFTTAMQPDVRVSGAGRSIECRLSGTPSGCITGSDYNPNGASGPYTTICTTAAACGRGAKPSPFCAPGAGSSAACTAGSDITATAALGQPSSTTVNPTAQCGSNPTCLAFASKFVGHGLRVTDSYNCNPSLPAGDPNACPASSSASDDATLVDLQFPVPVDCIANSEPAVAGSNCGVNTTANALVPGVVISGKAAVIELGEIQMFDSGPDGSRGNADDQRFATQGIFLP